MQTKWWSILLLSLLLVACQPFTPIPPQATPGPATGLVYDDYLARGHAYLESGDLELADYAYSQAIAIAPNVPEAYYWRAWVYQTQGDYQRQIDDLTQVIAYEMQPHNSPLDPSLLAHLYRIRAEAFQSLHDLAGMVADIEQCLALVPWQPHGWEYANLHFHGPRLAAHQAALTAYEATRTPPTTEAESAYDQGMRLLLEGQFLLRPAALERALETFTAALKADPTLAASYHKRALAQLALVQQQGDRYFTTAMESSDGNAVWTVIDNQTGETLQVSSEEYFQLTAEDVRLRQTMLESAQRDLESALTLTPNVAEVVHDLGVVHYLRAAAAGDVVTAGAPDDYVVPGEDGVAFALPYLDQAVELAPAWAQARFNRGMAYLAWSDQMTGREDELIPAQEAALEQAAGVVLDDARSLIAADPNDLRGYFLRINGAIILETALASGGAGELTEEQFTEDYLQAILLSGKFSFLEEPAIVDVQPSGTPRAIGNLASGTFELLDDTFVYIHRARGFRVQLPSLDSYWGGLVDTETAAGTLAVTARDTIDQYDLRIVDPAMPGAQAIFTNTGTLDVTEWISATMLPFWDQPNLEFHPSIRTPYGDAHVLTGDDTWAVAVLPLEGMMYVFMYGQLGQYPTTLSVNRQNVTAIATLTDFVNGFALLYE